MNSLRLLLPLLFCLLTATAFAQPKKSAEEQIQLLKVAYITKRLDLTTTEAEKFWPIYNDYEDKRDAAKKKLMENRRKVKNAANNPADSLSTKELEEIISYEAEFDENDSKLKKDLNTKLKNILPVKKIALLYAAEDEFKKELLRQVADADKKPKQDSTKPRQGPGPKPGRIR